MSSQSLMMRVCEQVLNIIRSGFVSAIDAIGNAATFVVTGAISAIGHVATWAEGYVENEHIREMIHTTIATAHRLMDEASVVVGNFSFYDTAYVIMHGAVPTAEHYMEMGIVLARTFSFYDWVFYFVCVNVVIVLVTYMLQNVYKKFTIRSVCHGVYYMPSTMLVFFTTTAFSATCTVMSRVSNHHTQASDEHNTNAVYKLVSTKAHELWTIIVFPYVYMYEIYIYLMVGVRFGVQTLFYLTVGAFETIGNMIWWCMVIMPVTFSVFVKSTLLCWCKALVAKMPNNFPTVDNKPMTIRQTPLLFHVCFHVMHTVFIVAVHTWTLYTLRAYWTQTVRFVLL